MLVQDEPQEDDVVTQIGDKNFIVLDEIAEVVDLFEIDYYKGWFRKGFVIYPNGKK